MNDEDSFINGHLNEMHKSKEDQARAKRRKLKCYIEFGGKLSRLADEIPSTKLRGPVIAKLFPDSKCLDPALRSNCKWLYEALNKPGHEAADILTVLNVESIFDLGSENPTVIRRRFLAAKA
ncbi:hypothetical protein [Paracoccus homiensis]|uniref:Uncharacterized protein n=1 Tax=Paracoccus homiensis TaxID=364199 RepID=A0A1I0J6R1_9RHOB|nr:hypothetical protein [Paracoccus homiensis]SEU04855.1 hypothetical protein SAMN04489858_12146 [Paracoccus homiensis]